MWQDEAACRGADPALFDTDASGPDAVTAARTAAEKFCSDCPVLLDCALDADEHREQGLWAGALRVVRSNDYRRRPLIDNAPELPLTERRPGVRYGWKTA